MITSKASQTTMSRIATRIRNATGCVGMSEIEPVSEECCDTRRGKRWGRTAADKAAKTRWRANGTAKAVPSQSWLQTTRNLFGRSLTDEFGADADFGFEKFRNWAAGFGGFDGGIELGLVGAGNGGNEVEMALGDGEAVADFIESDGRGGFQFLCGVACAAELRGQRHSEAAGLRRVEKFFRIGADAAFETRMERIRGLLENATVSGKSSFAGFQVALPDC